MASTEPDTEELLEKAAGGDPAAPGRLLERFRPRLRRMVAVRFDRRLAARADPSDVVQEALADAARRLPDYLKERPLPFLAWLRRLAWDRLGALHRRHVRAGRRSVGREQAVLPDHSADALAARLFATGSAAGDRLHRAERRERVRSALARLREADREVLVLRHLEQLSAREIAGVLGLKEGAVNVRHVRALQRLRDLL